MTTNGSGRAVPTCCEHHLVPVILGQGDRDGVRFIADQAGGHALNFVGTERGHAAIRIDPPLTMLKQGRKTFFPQYRALGLKVDEDL